MSWKLRLEATAMPYSPAESIMMLADVARRLGVPVIGEVNGIDAYAYPDEHAVNAVYRWQAERDSRGFFAQPTAPGPRSYPCKCERLGTAGAKRRCKCPCHRPSPPRPTALVDVP